MTQAAEHIELEVSPSGGVKVVVDDPPLREVVALVIVFVMVVGWAVLFRRVLKRK